MNIWIIYDAVRYQVNSSFAGMLTERFQRKGASVAVRLLEANEFPPGPFPDLAIMRTTNSSLSLYLEQQGVRVCNNSFVSKICNDKWVTCEFMRTHHIAIPETQLIYRADIPVFEKKEPKILKSRYGHGGKEVFRVVGSEEVQNAFATINEETAVLQRLTSDPGKDVRVYIIGNKIILAMLRSSTSDFRSNYSLGGHAEEYQLSPEERKLVEKILDLFRFDFAGIDFIFDNGKIIFNEIEDVVGCRMVYAKTRYDLAELYVDYLMK